jgi:hypothetical protein
MIKAKRNMTSSAPEEKAKKPASEIQIKILRWVFDLCSH